MSVNSTILKKWVGWVIVFLNCTVYFASMSFSSQDKREEEIMTNGKYADFFLDCLICHCDRVLCSTTGHYCIHVLCI